MYTPDIKTFKELAGKGNLIPVYKEVLADMETPVSAFLKLQKAKHAFLLESVEGGERIARYSFIGVNPRIIFKSSGRDVEIVEDGKRRRFTAERGPIEELKRIMAGYRVVEDGKLPRFFGGAVGYVGYDMVRDFEDVETLKRDDIGLPECCFMITDTILIFDHVNHTIKITALAHVPNPTKPAGAYRDAVKKIDALAALLSKPVSMPLVERDRDAAPLAVRSNMPQAAFEGMVKKAKEYIRAGDIIQVVLSQRLEAAARSSSFDVYRALRSVNPSPYMYYLRLGDFDVVGASPEILVRCERDVVTVRPIAGTAKRGASEAEDAANEAKLLNDPKE
ncbi:MAG TPA: chorismate-binding protein, partial [bacterium]|nr:chorismate-binding protein [bacterium]